MIDHGPPPVAETTGLRDRVKRLAESVQVLQTGFRRLSGNCPESLLRAVLCEIDETILPRRIKLVTDTDQAAYLHVAGRRLMRVSQSPDEAHSEPSHSATAAVLMGLLQTVFADATKAALSNTRSGPGQISSETGCTATMLAAAASLDIAPQPDRDPVPGLFTALSRHMTAFVTLDPAGNILKLGGVKDWSHRLDTLARHGLDDIDAQLIQSLPSPEHPGCIMLSAGGSGGAILLYARSQAAGFLAILPADALPSAQSAWCALPT